MAFVTSTVNCSLTPRVKTSASSTVTLVPAKVFVARRPLLQYPTVDTSFNRRAAQIHWSRPPTATLSDVPKAPPKILISGAPASGKGTQCNLLVEHYGVVHISTGDMLREAVKAETPLGLQAKKYMDFGTLVPDDLVISLLQDRIVRDDCRQKGWLLDGFPRTAVQAKALDDAGITPSAVLVLEVPDDILVERVVGRRIDPETGEIYHVKFNPAPSAEIAARLVTRSDDTEEKARIRLRTYYEHSQSILDHYSSALKKIDGNRSKSEVFDDIVGIIDENVNKPMIQDDTGDDDDGGGSSSSSALDAMEASSSAQTSDSDSVKGASVLEFVRKAEEAYERGRLYESDVNWSGQAGAESPDSYGNSTYADIARRPDLALGDAMAILLFIYIGRYMHGYKSLDFALLKTAAPFLSTWFCISPLLGCYTRSATSSVLAAFQHFVRGWAVAIPMGIALRGKLMYNF